MEGIKAASTGPITEIVIDRPKANAIDLACSRKLGETFCRFRDDPAQRVAVITGAGSRFFCGGWDVSSDESMNPGMNADYGPGGLAGLTALFDLSKPVIAAVNGYCIGAGLELVLACDIIIASEGAEFFLPEVNIGIPPQASSIQRLINRVPQSIANEMMFTSARMTAAQMVTYGLVNHVVPQNELRARALGIAGSIAGASPLALAACKTAKELVAQRSAEEAHEMQFDGRLPLHARAWESEDSLEGARAFVAKRKPVWTGD